MQSSAGMCICCVYTFDLVLRGLYNLILQLVLSRMNCPCLLIDEKSQWIALPEHVTERPCPGFKTLNDLRVGTEQEKPFVNEHLAR